MRQVLATLVLGTILPLGTSMACAHGGVQASPIAHTISTPAADLPDYDYPNGN
ncbi:MAG TPA: hypothetical protein VKZ50_07950 [bacterium]|nr:hypothetical protein [bacterium]